MKLANLATPLREFIHVKRNENQRNHVITPQPPNHTCFPKRRKRNEIKDRKGKLRKSQGNLSKFLPSAQDNIALATNETNERTNLILLHNMNWTLKRCTMLNERETKRVLDRIELKCGGPHSGIDIDGWIGCCYAMMLYHTQCRLCSIQHIYET